MLRPLHLTGPKAGQPKTPAEMSPDELRSMEQQAIRDAGHRTKVGRPEPDEKEGE